MRMKIHYLFPLLAVIACGSGAVRVLEVQAPGGKQMKSEDYLRGHNLEKELL